jgi:5-methylcytosine-specific restriction enzyme subunit McrC
MLLLNYRPDICHGRNHILAILFDMNDLWEEYVYRQLVKFTPFEWRIIPQDSKYFWEYNSGYNHKIIKPDIVLYPKTNDDTSIILDTKWKIPEDDVPNDADLKQMFAYNEYWNGMSSYLVYPSSKYSKNIEAYDGDFVPRLRYSKAQKCGLLKISVLNKQNTALDERLGSRLIRFLKQPIDKPQTP